MYMVKKLHPKLILFLICTALFLIPNFFWFNHLYNVGGDDTMLYYLFPQEMIHNYAFNLISDNGLSILGGYAVQSYQAPFFFLIYLTKIILPFLNTQTILYGSNLAFGFLFFYLFLDLWIANTNSYNFFIKILSSFLYIFSLFSYYDLWSSLFVLYFVTGFPLILYLFFKGLLSNNIIYIILDAIFLSVFSILILSTPWFALGLLAILPLSFIIFLQNKKRFILFLITFVSLIILYNFYWLSYFIYPLLPHTPNANTNIISDVSSTSSIITAENTIKSVTKENNFIYPLANLVHKDIQISYKWENYKIFSSWHEKFIFINMIFTAIIILVSFKIKKTNIIQRHLYIAAFLGWIIILYFYTVKIGDSIGQNIFFWMNSHIPGFAMFRNSYGKIAPAFPFIYALLFGISLKILFDNLTNKKTKIILLIVLTSAVILNTKPFIFNEYFNNTVWTTKNTYSTISGFNPEFYSLTSTLKEQNDTSRVIWLPISAVSYIFIRDAKLPNHYYIGPSPVLFLSHRQDLSGLSGLPSSYSQQYNDYLNNRDYDAIGRLLQQLNINYIVWNEDISGDLQQSFLFARHINDTLYNQQRGKEFKKIILGEKVADFNGRYQLYKINPTYNSKKIFLADKTADSNFSSTNVSFTKDSSYRYIIHIKNLKKKSQLVFLDTYNSDWTLYTEDGKTRIPFINHDTIYNYANRWTIDPKQIMQNVNKKFYSINNDGSIDISIVLYFTPQSYFPITVFISILSVLISILFISKKWILKKK